MNYGNGQVSETFKSRAAADRHLDSLTEYKQFAFVQRRYEGGDWIRIG